MIESLFGDGTCSWIMIVNGINKYETEMTEETQDDHIDYIGECTGKCVKLFVLGSVQRAVERHDLQHGNHGVLRDLRDHSKHTMHQLFDILAESCCIHHMRNMLTTFRESSNTQQ